MTQPEQARQDLARILSEGRVEMSEAQARMAERGHPPGRIDRARRALEVETIREGPIGSRQTFHWQLPTTCPTCSRPFRADDAPAATPWGRTAIGDYWQQPRSPIEPASHDEDPPPMPPPVPHYEPAGPPRCNVCGRTSAMDFNQPCPWSSNNGVRCVGVMT